MKKWDKIKKGDWLINLFVDASLLLMPILTTIYLLIVICLIIFLPLAIIFDL